MASKDTYQAPAVQLPTLDTLQKSAEKMGFELPPEKLAEMQETMKGFVSAYTLVDTTPEVIPAVKYPRTPGYRPSKQEDTHNAWYWKCSIKGAESGPLLGKKIAVKDNICVAGVPMMNGSRLLEGYIPEFDAPIVTRILDAGGEIAGKAACEDLCFSGSSSTNAKATVLNPNDHSRSAGGSSSGSAVLVALGEVDMALGGDQGGSIRMPASWTGIVGMKPTYGLVPYTGAMTLEPTIDHLGPMAKTVEDVALLLETIAGAGADDFRQPVNLSVQKYTEFLTGDIEGLKIGFLEEGFANCTEEVQDVVKKTKGVFEKLNASVDWLSIPMHINAKEYWMVTIQFGVWIHMIQSEGTAIGHKGFYPTSLSEYLRRGYKTTGSTIFPVTQCSMLFADYIKENYGNKFYNKVRNICPMVTEKYLEQLKKFDVLVLPTMPYVAEELPLADVSFQELHDKTLAMVMNTAPINYVGLPAITINAGFLHGLPVGVMIVGKHFDDGTVLKVAHALEKALKN